MYRYIFLEKVKKTKEKVCLSWYSFIAEQNNQGRTYFYDDDYTMH